MRRLLVTGGCGFIGSNFVRHWLDAHADDRVVNLDALTYAGNPANLAGIQDDARYRFVRGDICDQDQVRQLLAAENIDTVVHFAAESHVDRSIVGSDAFVRTNVQGTLSLLQAAREVWGDQSDGRCFLHVSTDEVYGSLGPEDPAFTETSPYRPNSPYAASKAASDHLARAFFKTYGLPVRITNCSNNYGPYQFPEKLIPLVILNALEGRPLPVYGDGRNVRDWLHVSDHCRGIEAVIERGRTGGVYNIGGNNEHCNIDIVRAICRELDELEPAGSPREDLITFVADRPGHDRRYAIDASLIERETGWRPAYRFETGLAETVRWYLEHRAWCDDVRSGEYQSWYERQYG